MIYRVRHLTTVKYDAVVQLARFNLRLRPIDWPGQTVSDYGMTVSPKPTTISAKRGAFPVNISHLVIENPLSELVIDSSFTVAMESESALAYSGEPSIAEVRAQALTFNSLAPEAPANYLYAGLRTPLDQVIAQWAMADLAPSRGVIDGGLALTMRIKDELAYDSEATEADTPVTHAFAQRRGVCQDFAHIMVVALRMSGLPAAYVSGYLRTDPPPGQPRLVGADATHAWVAIWCGTELGWIGFDPTNGVVAGVDHVVTALGRDYADVMPMDGLFIGHGGQDVDVSVDVMPLN